MSKRALPDLSSYGSEEDDDPPLSSSAASHCESGRDSSLPSSPQPNKKPKLLPSLSTSFLPTHVDDPSKHRGRIRAKPHVEGQFVSHIYISLPLIPTHKRLRDLIKEVTVFINNEVPEFVPLVGTEEEENGLHVSLSRPIYIGASQRAELKNEVRRIASQFKTSLPLSFACFTDFTNDERTRTFVSLEIGAGHSEMEQLSKSFTPHLTSIHQKPYYELPRFHASIGWALLSVSPTLSSFPSVEKWPDGLIDTLNSKFGEELRRLGRWDSNGVECKIGKDVHKFKFGGGA